MAVAVILTRVYIPLRDLYFSCSLLLFIYISSYTLGIYIVYFMHYIIVVCVCVHAPFSLLYVVSWREGECGSWNTVLVDVSGFLVHSHSTVDLPIVLRFFAVCLLLSISYILIQVECISIQFFLYDCVQITLVQNYLKLHKFSLHSYHDIYLFFYYLHS